MPSSDAIENLRLRAERDQAFRQLDELRREISRLAEVTAGNNDRLDQVLSMLRRREAQLRKAEAEIRRLRRELGLPVEDPDPEDPEPEPPPAPSSGSAAGGNAGSDGPTGRKGGGSGQSGRGGKPRAHGGRRPPPEHLETDTHEHPAGACAECGGTNVRKRDVVRSRKYDVVRSYVRVREDLRETVVCLDCNHRTTAEMPPMPCERSLVTSGFLAWLVVMKFVLLVPLDRIRRLLLSQGVDLAESTLVHLIAQAASLADAVDGEHWRQLQAGLYLCFDGTGLKTLIVGQDKAWDGYLEVYTREALTVFQFDLTKHADRLRDRLAGYAGTVVCDAESRNAAATPAAKLANCNAHPRRKFRDAEGGQPHLAAQGGRFIQAIYALEEEAQAAGLTGDALREFRQRRIGRVFQRFRTWLDGVLARDLPPSDPVRKAAKYYVNHFDELKRFVDDPTLPLDNNQSEREFQHHAKLRLQSLFAGSPEGAHRWATLLGVVRTAQKTAVEVQAYLTWLFDRRGTHRKKFAIPVEDLTPMAYKRHLEEAARQKAA